MLNCMYITHKPPVKNIPLRPATEASVPPMKWRAPLQPKRTQVLKKFALLCLQGRHWKEYQPENPVPNFRKHNSEESQPLNVSSLTLSLEFLSFLAPLPREHLQRCPQGKHFPLHTTGIGTKGKKRASLCLSVAAPPLLPQRTLLASKNRPRQWPKSPFNDGIPSNAEIFKERKQTSLASNGARAGHPLHF